MSDTIRINNARQRALLKLLRGVLFKGDHELRAKLSYRVEGKIEP